MIDWLIINIIIVIIIIIQIILRPAFLTLMIQLREKNDTIFHQKHCSHWSPTQIHYHQFSRGTVLLFYFLAKEKNTEWAFPHPEVSKANFKKILFSTWNKNFKGRRHFHWRCYASVLVFFFLHLRVKWVVRKGIHYKWHCIHDLFAAFPHLLSDFHTYVYLAQQHTVNYFLCTRTFITCYWLYHYWSLKESKIAPKLHVQSRNNNH